jgi:hypothetical protein
MSRYKELVELFFSDDYRYRYSIAKTGNKCMKCGNGLKSDINPSEKLEYSISALCPDCMNVPNDATPEVTHAI